MCQGKQSLDEPVPLVVWIDRVVEFPDRVLQSLHQLPCGLTFLLLNFPQLGQALLVCLGELEFMDKIPLHVRDYRVRVCLGPLDEPTQSSLSERGLELY